jgi:hypothetical protein
MKYFALTAKIVEVIILSVQHEIPCGNLIRENDPSPWGDHAGSTVPSDKRKEHLFWGCGFSGDREFPLKPFHDLLFYLHRVSVGDYLPGKGPDPQNSTNSGKTSTNVLGYPRFVAGFGYRGRFRSGKSPLTAPIGWRNYGEMGLG